jgi:hypothetical protein
MRNFATGTLKDMFVIATIGSINTTSSYKNETVEGVVYLADSRLVSVSPIVVSDIKQVTYGIELANSSLSSFSNGMSVTVKNVYVTESDATVVIAYKGVISGISSYLKTDAIGESLIKLTCASPMYVLDSVAGWHISKDYPPVAGDTCFERSQDDVSKLMIKWGKK